MASSNVDAWRAGPETIELQELTKDSVIWLGNKIRKAVRSKRGEEILDAYSMNLWTEGGC